MDGLLSIYARNCELRRIDKPQSDAFLALNHRMGSTGGRFRYGMFLRRRTGRSETVLPEGTLVAVAVFSSARKWVKEGREVRSFEWIRYASLSGLRVVGGMSRMLDFFALEQAPDDVMSYADPVSADGGEVYKKLGFKSEGFVSKPNFNCEKFRKVYSGSGKCQ